MDLFKRKKKSTDYNELIKLYGDAANHWVLESKPLPDGGPLFAMRLAGAFVAKNEPISDVKIQSAYAEVDGLFKIYRTLSDIEIANNLDDILRVTALVLKAAKDKHDLTLIKNIEKSAPHSFLKATADVAMNTMPT